MRKFSSGLKAGLLRTCQQSPSSLQTTAAEAAPPVNVSAAAPASMVLVRAFMVTSILRLLDGKTHLGADGSGISSTRRAKSRATPANAPGPLAINHDCRN